MLAKNFCILNKALCNYKSIDFPLISCYQRQVSTQLIQQVFLIVANETCVPATAVNKANISYVQQVIMENAKGRPTLVLVIWFGLRDLMTRVRSTQRTLNKINKETMMKSTNQTCMNTKTTDAQLVV